jgi:hypothetical protein
MSGRQITFKLPEDATIMKIPVGLHNRLQVLLDKQDKEGDLSSAERAEAEELVDLAEWLSLLRARVELARRERARR